MATQLKDYTLVDDQTGKEYTISGPEDATNEELSMALGQYLSQSEEAVASPVQQAPQAAPAAREAMPMGAIEANNIATPTERLTKELRNYPDIDAALAQGWLLGEKTPEQLQARVAPLLAKYPELAGATITNQRIASARKYEAEAAARGIDLQGRVFAPITFETGEKDPEAPTGVVDTLTNAVSRSTMQVGNAFTGLAALGADVVGADETADDLLQTYIENNAKIAYSTPRPVDSYKDVDSFGDAGLYALDTIGELAPQIVLSGGGGLIGREAAKRIVAKSVDDMVEQQIAAGVTREAAEAAAKAAVNRAAQRGTAAGVFAPTWAQETGRTFGQTYEATGEKAPLSSIAAGTVSASLDSILPAKLLNSVFSPKKILQDRLASEIAKQGAKGFALESATEAAQEFVTSLPENVINGTSPFSEEMLDRYTEAFIRGGIGGKVVGSTGAVIQYARTGDARKTDPKFTEGGTIVVPTAKRNTKVYKQELVTAQEQTIDIVNDIVGSWTNPPKIEVHPNFKDVEGIDDDALGVYTEDGTVMINTEAVLARAKKKGVSPEAVVQAVTFHESLGHYGLTQKFGAELDDVLEVVYEQGTPALRNLVDTWIKRNPNAYKGDKQKVRATEEVLAEWAEKEGVLPKRLRDTVINKIKNFARDNFGINWKISERELRAYLAIAQRRVTEGAPTDFKPGVAKNVIEESDPTKVDRTDDTYSEGIKRPKTDERSKTEARKQFWRNKENPDWNPEDPNGLPSEPNTKYMQGDEPIDFQRKKFEKFDRENPSFFGPREYRPTPSLEEMEAMIEQSMARDREESLNSLREELKARKEAEDRIRTGNNKNTVPRPANDKYMRGDGPIDPDDISADDLIEAKDPIAILQRIAEEPTVVSQEELEQAMLARGLHPSDIVRLASMAPGQLQRRQFLFDVAAKKLRERLDTLNAKMQDEGLNEQDQIAFIRTAAALEQVGTKLFNLTGEAARTLNAAKRLEFTRKKVLSLREVLAAFDAEALNDPETFAKFMAAITEEGAARDPNKGPTASQKIYSVVNIPRSIMSSLDLSAPMRQGIVFIGYKEYWKAFAKMFTLIGPSGENNYKWLNTKISTSENYALSQAARVAYSSVEGEFTSREEDFQSEYARKIPVLGGLIKVSEQAYAGFLNKLRYDMFDRFITEYRKAGIFNGTQKDADGNLVLTPEERELLLGLGRFINSATGRAELMGSVGKTQIYDARRLSGFANATLFSARLMQSRVNMLNPIFYYNLPKPVRKQAIKSMISFGVIHALVIGSLALMFPDEVEVELDPRSSDFMKVRIDNTRVDLGGGFNQYLVLGTRIASWLYNNTLTFGDRQADRVGLDLDLEDKKIANKKTTAGNYKIYGQGSGNQVETYGDTLLDFLRSKSSPQLSLVVDNMVEEDYVGRPVTLEGSVVSRLFPMTLTSIYQAYNEDSPVPLPAIAGLTLFGAGVSTYPDPTRNPKEVLEAPFTFEMKDLEDGENDLIKAEGGTVTLKQDVRERWEATLNNYFPLAAGEVTLEAGFKSFDEAPKETQREIIKEAKERARDRTKEDMLVELGLAEPEEEQE